MSSDIAIRVQNLGKCYRIYATSQDRLRDFVQQGVRRILRLPPTQYGRDFWALKHASFEIGRGESVAVLGRNGSGKSTLLQLICGTLTPTEGTVEVKGRLAALLELGAGFHPEFTGRENVRMYGALLGLKSQQLDERFDAIAGFADIGPYLDQPVKSYSSGMYMRLAFAVIAHVDADILVIDEAMAVGDAFFVQKCMRFLRRFMDHGTILFVSHDTAAIKSLCSRALLLQQGRVTRCGSAKSVSDYYLQAEYESAQGCSPDGSGPSDAPNFQEIEHTRESDDSRDHARVPAVEASMFGTGKATIEEVALTGANGEEKRIVTRRERVWLSVSCRTSVELAEPIVGFVLRDRLGQVLFGQNTCVSNTVVGPIAAGSSFEVVFEFWMPMLNSGDYAIGVALAEGSQQLHTQHHWINDALIVKSCPDEVCYGSVGVEVIGISFRSKEHGEPCYDRGGSSIVL